MVQNKALEAFQRVLDDCYHGIVGNRTVAHNDEDVETVRAALQETPAAKWRENGEPDPHGERYNCPRSKLPYGNLTDDEFANAFYLCDHRRSLDSIGYLDAAKNRIRWLSRKLEEALQDDWQPIETAPKEGAMVDIWDEINDRRYVDCVYDCESKHWYDGSGFVRFPTHWKPPPKPPQGENDE